MKKAVKKGDVSSDEEVEVAVSEEDSDSSYADEEIMDKDDIPNFVASSKFQVQSCVHLLLCCVT